MPPTTIGGKWIARGVETGQQSGKKFAEQIFWQFVLRFSFPRSPSPEGQVSKKQAWGKAKGRRDYMMAINTGAPIRIYATAIFPPMNLHLHQEGLKRFRARGPRDPKD